MHDNEKTVLSYGFKLLTVNDCELFNKYRNMSDAPLSSCSNLPSIIGWEKSTVPYYKVVDGALCIIFNDAVYGSWRCYPPMCRYDESFPVKAIELLDSLFDEMGLPLHFYYVKDWLLPYFEGINNFTIEKTFDDSLSDYIYTYSDFTRYLNKADIQYNIRYFKRKFSPTIEWLTPENSQEYLDFLKEIWCPFHSCDDCVYGCMVDTLKNMLDSSKETGLSSFLVRSDGKCVAYAGYIVCDTEIVVLFKKVSRSMKGITDFVHSAIIKNASNDGISHINYTEDMGVEGLRKYKQKLAPFTLSRNYELILRRNLH